MGDFAGAAALIAEIDSVAEATGSQIAPYALLRLRALQGAEAEASALIASESRGQGPVAIMRTGRPRSCTTAWPATTRRRRRPGKPPRDLRPVHVSMWALPELVEAAARTGDAGLARDALERLAETTQPAGPISALGIEARCRALLSHGAAADGLYREAIDRLGRTRLRPELARAHLLYGEWLRREGRRTDAREQLRTAHDMLAAIGMEAFAERARRELIATGETVRKRGVETLTALTAQEALHRAAGPGRPDQPGDRRSAVPVRADGPIAPAQDLRQARHRLAPRAARRAGEPRAGQPAGLVRGAAILA